MVDTDTGTDGGAGGTGSGGDGDGGGIGTNGQAGDTIFVYETPSGQGACP